ncbi:MAG: elongation factor G, partial [Anaerolineales bacterium]
GIFAHVDAGKTTMSEAILYYTGRIHRQGNINDGDTQLDFMEQERERGITIMSAATACHWKDHRINLIDTPGHIDFTAEVVRSIRVIDGAVMVLCGVGGVEPQTETVWMHANEGDLARVIFINKLDRLGADYDRVLEDILENLTPNALPLQLPIGKEGDFVGVVDVLTQQALVWHDGADDPTVEPVPASMLEQLAAVRESVIDAICDTDDTLLEQRVEGIEPELPALRAALRKATCSRQLVPILCGASRNRIGVQPMLDAITGYLPSPLERPLVTGVKPESDGEMVERPSDPAAPLCASVFKIVTDPHVGQLAWVRVFSGQLKSGGVVLNPRTGERERIGRIYRMHGSNREQVGQMAASDVVALVGPKSVTTGDTLCNPDHPIMLDDFDFPEPVISVALNVGSNGHGAKLREAVGRLCNEDPTLISSYDSETGEEVLSGMGELHLEIAVDRLRREFGLEPQVSAPQVSYRETIREVAEIVTTYKKQSGGHGHFAEVVLRAEPLRDGEEGVIFENEAPPSEFPREFVAPTESGVRGALEKGVIAGFPTTGVRITLLGGKYHDVDSATMDFQIAGSMAARQVFRQAGPALLEPIMRTDINVGEEYLGAVGADMGRRRGIVNAVNVRGELRSVDGEVPLAEARGYATDLRSLTQGRGTFTLEFRRYEIVPEGIAAEVIEQRRKEGKIQER